jgi:hypothetical protein
MKCSACGGWNAGAHVLLFRVVDREEARQIAATTYSATVTTRPAIASWWRLNAHQISCHCEATAMRPEAGASFVIVPADAAVEAESLKADTRVNQRQKDVADQRAERRSARRSAG